jgi:hypothetical protein
MAVIVVGGHSRSIGKTSVVAGLIARLPEFRWTAFKITQYGHGFCTADGAPCDCQTDDHTIAISAERDPATGTDSARFLAAGAVRALWVRTRQGMLAEAMRRIRKEIAAAESAGGNVILESNSILQFLRPDLYLTVLDHATADFKDSARLYLDRADAILQRESGLRLEPRWTGVAAPLLEGKPRFVIAPPDYMTNALAAFVRARLTAAQSVAR